MTNVEVIYPSEGNFNITAELQSRESFTWDKVESNFSWSVTGKVNMAFECVDRHVVEGFGEKVALHYFGEHEEYTVTYRELKEKSDLWATVLKKKGVKKGTSSLSFYRSILIVILRCSLPLNLALLSDLFLKRLWRMQ